MGEDREDREDREGWERGMRESERACEKAFERKKDGGGGERRTNQVALA